MHRYEDALFHQVEHLRFLNSGNGVRYYEAFEGLMRQKEYDDDEYHAMPEGLTYAIARRIVERAEPAYIAPQIIDTINDALPSFAPEPLLPTDLFTAEGFAYFPRPVFVTDVNGHELPIRAMGWTPIRGQVGDGMEQGGVWLLFFIHRDDETPGENGVQQDTHELVRNMAHASLTVCHSFWMPYNNLSYTNISDERYQLAAQRQWCAVQVLWRLAGQVVKTVTRAPRAARRDARRHGVDQDHVVVVTLRKVKSITSGGELMEETSESDGNHYSVQFPVKGHWHTYWYPTLQQHRQVWVDTYWKGPEDAPVQNSRRVFEVTR
jgi:hypothetical protein